MSRKQNYSRFSMRKQKSYLTVGVIALVAVIAMAGIYYKNTVDRKAEEQEAVIMAESEWTEDTDGTDESDTENTESAESDSANDSISGQDGGEELQSTVNIEGEVEDTAETAAVEETASFAFTEADTLTWPLSGDVILNYSMDQSVYFATLDQYKYNPALIIAGDVNSKVTAAADGQVLSVEITEETGETIAVDIGNGYQLLYGQLKDVQFSPGDTVRQGDLIGFVSEPTKYYSVEGSNLYFQMMKDGVPVNPMNYMQ